MIKTRFKLLTVILVFVILTVSNCTLTNQITQTDLSSWNAESENVTNLSVLLEDDGIEGNPVLLDENTLIFESKKNDNYDLWTINLKSQSGIRQLTTHDGYDRLACVHPDKNQYVFLSDRSEVGFYLGEIGKPTVISLVKAQKPNFGDWASGDISPDGKVLLYVSGKYIWTYNFETKTKTQFVQGSEPKWTPNGDKIIFTKIGKELNNKFSTSVWVMNSDGTEQTEIINGSDEYSYSEPKFSPDGKKIMYLKQKITSTGVQAYFGNPDIWICNSDGTDHEQITTHPLSDKEAIWVDNKTIIFCSDRPQSGNIADREWDLWQLQLY